MQFVVFTGLPGSGKSRLAEGAGKVLSIPAFAKDWLEGVLKRHGIKHSFDGSGKEQSLGYVGYELLTTLAMRQLQLGQSVILDSVVSAVAIRNRWRTLASEYSAQWRVIECICSDETLHRARLAERQRNIPHWLELEWSEVERVKSYYPAWDEDRLVVDAVQPFEINLEAVLRYLVP
jgi:predicted kinase